MHRLDIITNTVPRRKRRRMMMAYPLGITCIVVERRKRVAALVVAV
jgi:hypothetical protein